MENTGAPDTRDGGIRSPWRLWAAWIAAVGSALAALVLLACGGGDASQGERNTNADAEPSSGSRTQSAADLEAIKSYLLSHSGDLAASTAELRAQGERYYALARDANFDYERLLRERREEVAGILEQSKGTYSRANPQYEEMEGIVAGVPSLADYDVIIDAGSAGDDPENAVPFDLRLPDGRTLKQPGNFFFLTETALYGTNRDLLAKGAKADLNGDGRVEFGEAVPDANIYVTTVRDFERYARELDREARAFRPTESDVLSSLVVMTPTMSEYFEAWKNSRFVAGEGASEQAFVATSRLSDITDILSGLVVTYDGVEPLVRRADPQQAAQTGEGLDDLRAYAARLRDREEGGKKFTAEQADTLGSEAQRQAEGIAGQVSQAAEKLNIEIQEG